MIYLWIDGLIHGRFGAYGILRQVDEQLVEHFSGAVTLGEHGWTADTLKIHALRVAFEGITPEAQVHCVRPLGMSIMIELPGKITWISASTPECRELAYQSIEIAAGKEKR